MQSAGMVRGRERRKADRHRARVRVRFWNESEQLEGTGVTTDLSDTGLFIETKTSVPLDTRLYLEIDLDSGPYTAVGTVARVLRASRTVQPVIKPGLGVRIVGLLEALEDWERESVEEELEDDLDMAVDCLVEDPDGRGSGTRSDQKQQRDAEQRGAGGSQHGIRLPVVPFPGETRIIRRSAHQAKKRISD